MHLSSFEIPECRLKTLCKLSFLVMCILLLSESYAIKYAQCLWPQNFFIQLLQTANGARNYASNVENLRQYHSTTVLNTPNGRLTPAPAVQIPSASVPASSIPAFLHDSSDTKNSSNQVSNLLRHSTFFSSPSSSSLLMPPITSSAQSSAALHYSLNLQRQHDTPMLQPFPPPNPAPSLAPNLASPSNRSVVISREKVHDALLSLVQVLYILFVLLPYIT